MRRILFSIAVFLLSLSSVMGQMIPINLPADGNWPTIVGDSIMIIGPKQEALTEEQRYFNPVYLMVYPGKEHLKNDMIRAALCDCDPTKPNRRIGVFSVAPDKQVSFSQGNLQYLPAANIWKFADTQYEYLGNANKYLKPTFRNWVDLFGWSANNTTAPLGVSTSTNVADYAGTFVDWGIKEICGDVQGTWRTLSADEWKYLLNGRKNAAKLMGYAQINEINGFIFLPDDWHCPNDITFQTGVQQYADQIFTIEQWNRLEQAGAVFLPAAGRRGGTELLNLNEYGNYWSATLIKSNFASYFAFNNGVSYVDAICETYFGRPVRLVHDTIVPTPEPEYVDLGLSVKWATFNIGAISPEDYGDYFAWGETEPKETYSWANYKWGTSSNLIKYNTTDGKTILDLEDDAAYVNWGGAWRMPTDEEFTELREKCTWTWTTQDGVKGYKITGPSGNSIFIPAAGFHYENGFNYGENGDYWSAEAGFPNNGIHLNFYPDKQIKSTSYRYVGFPIRAVYDDVEKHYRNGITQANWNAATELWGHGGRGHAPTNQSCIQGTIVHGIRLKIARKGSLDVYKVPSLLEKTEDNFELVAILTTDSTGVQDFDFDQPIYIAPNEYLVFGKPSAKTPTLLPCYINSTVDDSFPDAIKGLTHRIGSKKVASSAKNASLMVEFY